MLAETVIFWIVEQNVGAMSHKAVAFLTKHIIKTFHKVSEICSFPEIWRYKYTTYEIKTHRHSQTESINVFLMFFRGLFCFGV